MCWITFHVYRLLTCSI
jgi:coatomer protein complex subunit epsilon